MPFTTWNSSTSWRCWCKKYPFRMCPVRLITSSHCVTWTIIPTSYCPLPPPQHGSQISHKLFYHSPLTGPPPPQWCVASGTEEFNTVQGRKQHSTWLLWKWSVACSWFSRHTLPVSGLWQVEQWRLYNCYGCHHCQVSLFVPPPLSPLNNFPHWKAESVKIRSLLPEIANKRFRSKTFHFAC